MVSRATDLLTVYSADRYGGRKLRLSEVYTGVARLGT